MDQDKSVIFEEHMDTINRYLTQVLITLSFGRRNPVGSAPAAVIAGESPTFEMDSALLLFTFTHSSKRSSLLLASPVLAHFNPDISF